MTIPGTTAIRSGELWVLTGTFVALGVTCFAAHWDVNRGRKAKHYETEELAPGSD